VGQAPQRISTLGESAPTLLEVSPVNKKPEQTGHVKKVFKKTEKILASFPRSVFLSTVRHNRQYNINI
jgi:hypothetical protein